MPREIKLPASKACIDCMVRRIVKEFKPDQIILFGSHARGEAGADSDVDLLVVMPVEGSVREKRLDIRLAAGGAAANEKMNGVPMRNTMLFAILMAAIVALADSDAEASWQRCPDARPDSPVALTLISPGDVLVLKTDLAVRYRIAPGVKFADVKLRVTNKKGELVYMGADLPAITGEHQAVWPKAMWNQTPHVGALANPHNGPYAVALVAKGADGLATTLTVSLPTQLVVQCDLWDGKPSKDEISSGLYRPMLDPKSPECLRVGLVRKGGKVADAVYAPTPPEFSNIVEADLDNDPSDGLEIESARIRQVMPSTFPDGVYNVVFANCRDLAGNRGVGGGLPDGIMPKWIVTLR